MRRGKWLKSKRKRGKKGDSDRMQSEKDEVRKTYMKFEDKDKRKQYKKVEDKRKR